jgi:hypothetical protein
MWCVGKVRVAGNLTHKLKPFHLLKGTHDLPSKKLVTELDNKWKPMNRKMMEAPGNEQIPANADKAFVQESYARGTEYLKENKMR